MPLRIRGPAGQQVNVGEPRTRGPEPADVPVIVTHPMYRSHVDALAATLFDAGPKPFRRKQLV